MYKALFGVEPGNLVTLKLRSCPASSGSLLSDRMTPILGRVMEQTAA